VDRLYIVRHGIAVDPGTPGYEDDQRPLTPKGERQARKVGRGMRRYGVEADRIVTSPLPRARRTAELIAAELELEDQLEDADALRADQSAESIRGWLASRGEDRLILVGHNPAFSRLVGLLLVGPQGGSLCELAKGGVAALASGPLGGLRLDWLATPRLLRRLD